MWLTDKAKPKSINGNWIWVCKKCESPMILLASENGYQFTCKCNKITYYKCLGCGREKFLSPFHAHWCNGVFRKHKFPKGFTIVND